MVELEKGSLGATMAGLVDECAPATVALVHFAPDRSRNVAGLGLNRRGRCVRLAARREALFLHALDQHVQGTFEDRGEVAIRNAMGAADPGRYATRSGTSYSP
ncbi:MAG: hypothetical protein LC689_11450 [Myxococcales bacterium]|nr:hypothetical protein [Myxococcales bacterium]